MARFTGRNAAVYVALTSGGSAEPLRFTKSFTIDNQTDQLEVTAQQDQNKVFLASLPGASGQVDGYKDAGAAQLLKVARGGFAAKTYFYEDTLNAPTAYHFCTANWSAARTFDATAAVGFTGQWTASSDFSDGPGIT